VEKMKTTISRDVAEADFDRWAKGTRRLRDSQIASKSDSRDEIVSAIEDGVIRINEDGVLEFDLIDEIGESGISTLKFKTRMKADDLNARMYRYTEKESAKRINAMVSCLTGESESLIGKIETTDQTVVHAVADFFR